VSLIALYKQFFEKEKLIYMCMNNFKGDGIIVQGVCWSYLNKAEFIEAFYGSQEDIIV
jgi:hypothetical protein